MSVFALPSKSSWHAEGLRWIGSLFNAAADSLDRASAESATPAPMPRHTSFDEIVGDVRNRMYSDFGTGQRPYY